LANRTTCRSIRASLEGAEPFEIGEEHAPLAFRRCITGCKNRRDDISNWKSWIAMSMKKIEVATLEVARRGQCPQA
jgi:hypothetical protein